MKKVLKKFNRALSIMLAAAMVLTMVPQTAMPVLAAENDVAIEETADVGETSEGLSDEQNEEVTEPSEEDSEEGNSEDEGDDIANEDPADEDPIEEEPSEGDLEEVEEPAIGLMGEDDDPPADTDTFNVTLPTNPQGYTITDAAETATKDTDYTFKVTAKTGYKIKAVKYTISDTTADADPVADAENTYKVPGTAITADITITVEAVQTVTVTVNANADTLANVSTYKYSVDGGDAQNVESPITVEKGAAVKLTVIPKDETIAVIVKKGNTSINGTENVYDLGVINANATYTVTATKNKYKITEDINEIKVTEGEGDDAKEVDKISAVIDYTPSGKNFTETESNKMIVAKQDLKFNVNPAAGVDFTGKKVIVSYKIGADAKEEILAAATTGVYTISKAKITDDITLKVVVREPEKYTVTLKKNDNIKATFAIGASNDFADFPNPVGDVENSVVADVAEDSAFKFKLAANDYYKITKVMVGETVLTAKSGVYSFNVTENATIDVTTELDMAQFKTLTFKLTGDAKSATAVLAQSNDLSASGELEVGKAVDIAAKAGDKVTLTITPEAGYTIDKVTGATEVTVSETAETETAAKAYEVKFAAAKAATVTVTTKVTKAADNSVITFVKGTGTDHVSYTVTGDKNIDKAKAADDEYTVKAGAEKLLFTITAKDSYEPTVIQTSKDDEKEEGKDETRAVTRNIKASKTTIKGTDATYEYVIPASLIAEGDTFTITAEAIENTVTIDGDVANADVVVSKNGRAMTAPYKVGRGETVAVSVTQKDGCTLSTVDYTVGSEKRTVTAKNGAAAFSVVVTDDTTVTINAKADYKAVQLQKVTTENDETKTSPVTPDAKGVYPVSYDGTYKVGLTKGTSNTPIAIAEIQVFDGNNPVADGSVTVNKDDATIKLTDAVAGKKLTAKLFVAGEGDDAANVDAGVAYTLQVSKEIKAASQIKVSASVSQPTDRVEEYPISVDGDLDKLTVSRADGVLPEVIADVKIDVAKKMLVIKTGQKATEAAGAKVIVSAGDGVEKVVTVKSTALISDKTPKPTVTLAKANDISLTLAVSAKNIKDAAEGQVYYKVEVTPQAGTDRPATLLETVPTQYVEKINDSQIIPVTVANEGTALGGGDAWKYGVKVTLVHAKDKEKLTDDNFSDKKVAESQVFETAANKPFETLKPAWESNLKLKKGTTTLYTGQPEVMIATPQFSKTTTYTDLTVEDISHKENGPLKVWVNKDNGLIYASAVTETSDGNDGDEENGEAKATKTQYAAVGKHTIQVTASAHKNNENKDTMYASRATIVVTVERGIDGLSVSVPSYSLYKANGKAATIKPTAIFNGDETGKNKAIAPKTKKVTWAVVKADSDDLFDPKVTINKSNGTVTVAKDYILKVDDKDNKFRIKVSVDNGTDAKPKWIGAAEDAYSEPITITNEGLDMSKLVIVDSESNVLAISTESKPKDEISLEASKLNGATVRVVNASAVVKEKEVYSVEPANEISSTNLAYKSSKPKDVIFNGNVLTVTKANTKPVLTVTANDGSKATLGIKLNVGNDKTEGKTLGLEFYPLEVKNENGNASEKEGTKLNAASEKNIDFTGTRLMAKVVAIGTGENAEWAGAPAFANYEVKVTTGGTKPEQIGNKISFTAKEKVVKVNLTDKSTNVTTEYVLTSKDLVDKTNKTKVTASVQGSLHKVGKTDEQKVTINLQFPTQESAEELKAKVDLDWTKMNAKNSADLYYFRDSLKEVDYTLSEVEPAKKAGESTASFELSFKDDQTFNFNQNSYALKVILGKEEKPEGASDSVFTALAPAATATVKVTKTAKFTFKPTTSYTIGAKDGYAVLGGKSSIPADELKLEFKGLLNLADKNGIENEFAKKFEIKGGKLKLQSGVSASDINKDNNTGYLVYTATTDKTYYDTQDQSGLVKITVKVNANGVVKYTHDSADIGNQEGSSREIQIKVDSKDAIDTVWSGTGNKAIKIVDARLKKASDQIKVEVKDNKLLVTMLKDADVKKVKKITADIYIVPEDSDHASTFVDEEGKAKDSVTEKDYKDYAATVKLNLNVTEVPPTAASIAQKIKTAVDNATITAIEYKDNTISNADAVKESITNAIAAAKIAGIDAYNITLADTFTVEPPAAEKAGSASIAITVTNKSDSNDTDNVTITLEIAELPAGDEG